MENKEDYLIAGRIIDPMVKNLGDDRNSMWVTEGEVNGVPVTIELMRTHNNRYMAFVETKHEKGFYWQKILNEYLDFAYNKVS